MYAYTITKRDSRIVGVIDSQEEYDKFPDFVKKDIDIILPDKVYDAADDDELKIQKLFEKAGQYWEFWKENDKILIDIDGDWKHDHIFCDHLMASLGYKCEKEFLLEESESDWYNARHIYAKNGPQN